jgi:hypothetical protein
MPESYTDRIKSKRQTEAFYKAVSGPKQGAIAVTADMKPVTDALKEVIKGLAKLDDGMEVRAIVGLSREVRSLQTAIDRQTMQITRALGKIELSPQINVPEPTVINNTTPSVNTKSGINLADYRAHDLDDAPDGVQYIGFISQEGKWYICQSDDKKNTMRYYFGKGDYDTEWLERYSHEYKTLSEAIRSVAA